MFLLFFFFKRRSAGDINKIPLNFATAGMPFEQAQEIFSYAKSQATALGVIIPPPRHCSQLPPPPGVGCQVPGPFGNMHLGFKHRP